MRMDLANAHGSIPHRLIEESLKRYHILHSISNLIIDYYNNVYIKSSSGVITSDWHRLEVCIIIGCTVSVILFIIAFNLLIKSTGTRL